tara:strand:- start:1951 stop:2673 length:723 start_codon:yes stop_codon:yes gene_type:complete
MKNYKIAVNGFFGRMGQTIYSLSKDEDYEVTVGIDREENFKNLQEIKLSENLLELEPFFDVVIDFSLPDFSIETIKHCIVLGKPITVGTTGFTDEQKETLLHAGTKIPILVAPNMSIGVNASLRSISELSKVLSDYDVHIEETHHKNKVDSPSGTALKIAEVIAEARNINYKDIRIDAFREEGEIGVHKTVFKSPDDEIILFHNAFNRKIFAKGALQTSQWVAQQKPGLYSYKDYMDSLA